MGFSLDRNVLIERKVSIVIRTTERLRPNSQRVTISSDNLTRAVPPVPFDIAAVLIVLAATFGHVKHRSILMALVGLTLTDAFASLAVLAVNFLVPSSRTTDSIVELITGIAFHQTLKNGILSFLLFAGALHVDWSELPRERWTTIVLSTIGVLLSTMLLGTTIERMFSRMKDG